MEKLRIGQLVRVNSGEIATFSSYGGKPQLLFKRNMLGVVRLHHNRGVHVEFYAPETGLIELCNCCPVNLTKLDWPEELVDLREMVEFDAAGRDVNHDWWFCGSMGPKGAMNYLRAIALLHRAYFEELRVETLRIPGYHCSRVRSKDPVPECFLPRLENAFHRATELTAELGRMFTETSRKRTPVFA